MREISLHLTIFTFLFSCDWPFWIFHAADPSLFFSPQRYLTCQIDTLAHKYFPLMLCPHFQLNKPLYTTTSFLRQSCLCVRNKVARTLILFNFFKNLLKISRKISFVFWDVLWWDILGVTLWVFGDILCVHFWCIFYAHILLFLLVYKASH